MSGPVPVWLSVHTRRVLRAFIGTLARTYKWNALYLISPWISTFDYNAGMTFDQLLKRLSDDDATVYVVTRPPVEEWHQHAVEMLAATRKTSIKLVETLHTKLYCARTVQSDFVLMGSANLTQQSLENRELGVLIRATGAGKPLVRQLTNEAAEIYRTCKGTAYCTRQL